MTFSGAEDRWLRGVGRLRDVVRQHLVAAQLREVLGDAAGRRVLDIGCGQGTQALALARAGGEVTGLDPSPQLLSGEELEQLLAAEAEAARRTTDEPPPHCRPGPVARVLSVVRYVGVSAGHRAARTS
jgi:SAM-dependent methyltransferase